MPLDETQNTREIARVLQTQDISTSSDFSRVVSEKLFGGRPVLVVPLNLLRHALTDPLLIPPNGTSPFDLEQQHERGSDLIALNKIAFPHNRDFWRYWDSNATAFLAEPNSSYVRQHDDVPQDNYGLLQPRLKELGNYYALGAVVFAPDERWSPRSIWAHATHLNFTEIEGFPDGNAIKKYMLWHEIMHVAQRRESSNSLPFDPTYRKNFRLKWRLEFDADQGAIDVMEAATNLPEILLKDARDFKETVQGIVFARALNGFLGVAPHYWSALALDDHLNNRPIASAEQSRLSGYELRWRAYSKLACPNNCDQYNDSATIQNSISQWLDETLYDRDLKRCFDNVFDSRSGNRFDWQNFQQAKKILPALYDIYTSGEITDPYSLRNTQLILSAAEKFCPSLLPVPQRPSAYGQEMGQKIRTSWASHYTVGSPTNAVLN